MIKKREYYIKYTILFIFIYLFAFLAFFLKKNSLIAMSDGYNEYYPVFAYSGQYYRSLLGDLIHGDVQQYDFAIGFGDDIIGTLNWFGFGSLLSIFSTFIPLEYSAYGYGILTLLKMYLSGVTFSYYLFYKNKDLNYYSVMAASLTYVFGTYSLYYGMLYPTFLDILIYLPLAIAGIEQMLCKENRKLISPIFIFAFFAQALSGFYFLYMLTAFCLIYFIVCSIVRKKSKGECFRRAGICMMNYILAIGLAAVIFVPALLAYFRSSRVSEGDLASSFFSLYDKKEYAKMFVNIFVKEGYQSGIGVPIICGFIIVLFVINYYEYRKQEKYREYGILLMILGIGWLLPCFGSIMNGFSYSIDRWIFMLLFVLASLMGEVGSECISLEKREWTGFIILFIVWCGAYWYVHEMSVSRLIQFILYGVIWVGSLGALYFYYKGGCKEILFDNKIVYVVCIGTIALTTFLLNAPIKIGGGGYSGMFLPIRTVYSSIINSDMNVENRENAGFYRLNVEDTSLGSSLILNEYGTTSYYSIINNNIYEFYHELNISSGIRGASFIFTGLDHREVLEDLLAVKNKDDEEKSIGLLYDTYYLEEQVESIPALERNLLLYQGVILSQEPQNRTEKGTDFKWMEESVQNVDFQTEFSNISRIETTLDVEKEGEIRISFSPISNDMDVWILMKGLSLETEGAEYAEILVGDTNIQLRGKSWRSYLKGNNDYLIKLSGIDVSEGAVTIKIPGGKYLLEDMDLYTVTIDDEKMRQLGYNENVDLEVGMNCVYGTVETSKDQILFLSIPYGEGWTYYLDNEKVNAYRADYGFTALEISAGAHVLIAEYESPGLKIGSIISVVSALGIVLLSIYQKRRGYK